ncbi:hypothetical protein FO519_006152 [Halicephalobus sp. NKZ332]|nr:hypothetical protein FO519_006152 [Halicephalobus sp. NKZ332]
MFLEWSRSHDEKRENPIMYKSITGHIEGASDNASFQLFFGNTNVTKLLTYADPENVTAAILLLNSAEEFYENAVHLGVQGSPGDNCSSNPVCNVTSDWLDSVALTANPLTRYNFIVLSDICVNEGVFNTTSNSTIKNKFPLLQSTYNYFISNINCTAKDDLYTFIKVTNISSINIPQINDIHYNDNSANSAVNIFIHVSSENLEAAIEFLNDYITTTDICSRNRSLNENVTGIQEVYYVFLSINYTMSHIYTKTIIPWVQYNSTEYFKEYVKQNIQYVMNSDLNITTDSSSNLADEIRSIYYQESNQLQLNILYTDSFPAWLEGVKPSKKGRPFDVILMLNGEDLDEDTVIYYKNEFYTNWQKGSDWGDTFSGAINLYILNSTAESSSIAACYSNIPTVGFSSVEIKANLWYLWLILPACLLVIGLCAARFFIMIDTKKNKTEFQKMISKLQLGEAPLLKTMKTLETSRYHDCVVAAKVSHQFGRDQVEGLICEVDAGRRLGFHPNICTLLGWTMHQGAPCLFFETMESDLLGYAVDLKPSEEEEEKSIKSMASMKGSVKSHDEESLLGNPFPTKLILKIFWQVANALAYISSMKIIHRDVAARNVLLRSGFVAKISDFGLSCDPDETTALYKASFNKKLPIKWLALEAIVDRIFSEKTDVWAFGVTLIEVFGFGRQPYSDLGAGEILEYLKSGKRLEKLDTMDDEM